MRVSIFGNNSIKRGSGAESCARCHQMYGDSLYSKDSLTKVGHSTLSTRLYNVENWLVYPRQRGIRAWRAVRRSFPYLDLPHPCFALGKNDFR